MMKQMIHYIMLPYKIKAHISVKTTPAGENSLTGEALRSVYSISEKGAQKMKFTNIL